MICKANPPHSIHEREDYPDWRENQARPYPRWKLMLDIVVLGTAVAVWVITLFCL